MTTAPKPNDAALEPPPPTATTLSRCQECSVGEALYQCPRCSFRSCSLACCVSHKKRLRCNGKRIHHQDKSFVPLSRMTDDMLQQDVFFLEHVLQNVVEPNLRKRPPSLVLQQHSHHNKKQKRRAKLQESKDEDDPDPNNCDEEGNDSSLKEPCHPLLMQQPAAGSPFVSSLLSSVNPPHHFLGGRHAKFRQLARLLAYPERRVTMVFMSPGMQRVLQNKTYISKHKKQQQIHWTVECVVHGPSKDNSDNDDKRSDNIARNNVAAIDSRSKRTPSDSTSSSSYGFQTILSEDVQLMVELLKILEQRQRQLLKTNTRNKILDALLTSMRKTTDHNNNNDHRQHTPKQAAMDDSHSQNSTATDFTLLLEQPFCNGGSQQRRRGKTYRVVRSTHTLREALQDSHLLEFPTVHFVPHSRRNDFPCLVVGVLPSEDEDENKKSGNDESDHGMTFF